MNTAADTTDPLDIVFLLDVDNTLLDNDQIVADLQRYLERELGTACASRYWAIFEALRSQLGYADYLGALQRYRIDAEQNHSDEPSLLQMSTFLVDYPFSERLYPRALDVIRRLNVVGRTVILSDGDVVFQPRKVQRSGLWDATCGRVLIYIHKEEMLDSVQRHYPAQHYVMIDDKLCVLAAMKKNYAGAVDNRLPASGPLRPGPGQRRHLSGGRFQRRTHRRLGRFDIRALLGPQGKRNAALASQEK